MPVPPIPSKPYLPEAPSGQVPTPCVITPALLKTHSITPDEYVSLESKLGRIPSLTELGIFSVMWSEHCSYKSSRVHLKRLPTKGHRTEGPGSVVQGPGENAGIIDVGDGWACAFKIESHNHPSYIEPYQGAATGVGGILRDIFTMNARPMAIMDSLRFGPLAPEGSGIRDQGSASQGSSPLIPDPCSLIPDFARNRHTMTGVVHGVSGYGNCFGVPNLGGETRFEPCYSGNPLLNAFALGLVRKDEIFYAKATGVGNPVIYVGAKTGRDGIHGATMASEEFTEGSEQKRPNVQMGDPFLEKLLLEACLEAMATGAVLGIQDMGAAGLTCSTCEMGARGELGVSIELDLVPQRETGMSSYEIMLSESQERMLLVAQSGREQEVLDIFAKWNLDAAIVGEVTADDTMRVFHSGVLIAEIPNKALTDEAPVYHRPVGTWTPPVPKDPPAWVLEELKKPRDYTADLKKLLASPNICSKHWIYEQYDSMVQTNTVQGPGGEAGVIRIKQGPGLRAQGSASQTYLGPAASFPSLVKGTASAVPDVPSAGSLASAAEGRVLAQPLETQKPTPQPQHSHPNHHHLAPATWAEAAPFEAHSSTPPDFLGPASIAAPAEGLDPLAVQHSVLGKIANFIAQSTPEAEAIHLTGNEDAANPVLAPGPDHTTGHPGSAATAPLQDPGAPSLAASPLRVGSQAPKPQRGLAMALAGNGRWCYLNPKLGAMHAVAEAARKVACTGATPVAATNCLNFGNPEKPEIMAQLSEAIDGIAEACTALGTPVTGGNVSLYNETRGEGIYPTPVIGVVGILDDVTKAVPSGFQREKEKIIHLWPNVPDSAEVVSEKDSERAVLQRLGSQTFAAEFSHQPWGRPPFCSLQDAANLNKLLCTFAKDSLMTSAQDVSDGGIAVAIARACLAANVGAMVDLPSWTDDLIPTKLFWESGNNAVLTCDKAHFREIERIAEEHGYFAEDIGTTGSSRLSIKLRGVEYISTTLNELATAFRNILESQISNEVLA